MKQHSARWIRNRETDWSRSLPRAARRGEHELGIESVTVAGTTGLLFGYKPASNPPADPADWEAPLTLLLEQGFTSIDFSQMWHPMTTLDDDAIERLSTLLARLGIETAGITLISLDLWSQAGRASAITRVRRGIDQASMLGTRFVSVGFHDVPLAGQTPSTAPGYPEFNDQDVESCAAPLRELAEYAASRSVELSLEMHESSPIYSSTNVLRILNAVGASNLGANPDLGNLIRAGADIAEEPFETVARLAGRINYWHVKNGVRLEVGLSTYRAFPTEMSQGLLDYRQLLRTAIGSGFSGPLIVEHYGGDILNQARMGGEYLVATLERLAAEKLGS